MASSDASALCGAISGRGCSDTSMVCTTSSTCSKRGRLDGRLGMATSHLGSQALERTQLQLLNRSFAFAEPLGDRADAALVHKPLVNDTALGLGELVYEPKQPSAVLDGAHIRMHARIGGIVRHRIFASRAVEAIDNRIRRNSQQPS